MAWHQNGIGNQLRSSTGRIEIAQYAIHSRLREANVKLEVLVPVPLGMSMQEKSEVLAHHEDMVKPFVNYLEITHGQCALRIDDSEREVRQLSRNGRGWRDRKMDGILDNIFNAPGQLHSAARAKTWNRRTNVRIHRTEELSGKIVREL